MRALRARLRPDASQYIIFASPADNEPDFNDIEPNKGITPLETSNAAAEQLYNLACVSSWSPC